jgi:hypothetical protein
MYITFLLPKITIERINQSFDEFHQDCGYFLILLLSGSFSFYMILKYDHLMFNFSSQYAYSHLVTIPFVAFENGEKWRFVKFTFHSSFKYVPLNSMKIVKTISIR